MSENTIPVYLRVGERKEQEVARFTVTPTQFTMDNGKIVVDQNAMIMPVVTALREVANEMESRLTDGNSRGEGYERKREDPSGEMATGIRSSDLDQ